MVMGEHIVMNMATHRMTSRNEILTLVQLLSPSFPVGSFAYSHGLENAIHEELIYSADDLQDWLNYLLTQGGGCADATLLNVSFYAEEHDVQYIDASSRAFASSKERLQETDLQGVAFCDAVNAVWGLNLTKLTYPVAVGRTARALGLCVELTTAMFLHAFIGNMCNLAMRLVPLGQTDGQRVQALLKPVIISVASNMKDITLDDLHSNTFMSDIIAMRHETQYSRIFRT
jgi:urease accessory protein